MDFAAAGDLLKPLLQASQTYGDALVPLGRKLLSLALVLTLLNAAYMWWAGAVSGAMASALRGLLIFSIPFFLLNGNNWTAATGSLANFFQVEVTQPLLAKGGGAGAGGGADLVKGMISKIGNSIWPEEKNSAGEKSGWDKTKEFLSNPVNSLGSSLFSSLTDFLLRVLLTVVGMGLIVAMLLALYSPLLMLQIGIILGPILICWLPFQPLADLSRQWFKFMVTSGMSLVVGVLLVLIVSTSIDSFVLSMQGVGNDPDLPLVLELAAKIGGFLSAAGVMIFIAVMLFKADEIASALVGGATAGGNVGSAIINKIQKVGDATGNKSPKDNK